MMVTNFLKTYQQVHKNDKLFLLPKKQFVTYAVYALIAVALIYLFVDPAAPSSSTTTKASVARPPWIQEDAADEVLPPPPSSPSSQEPVLSPSPSPYQLAGDDDDETPLLRESSTSTTTTAAAPPSPAPAPCDYSDGEWVPDPRPPLYNGTTCGAIKDDGRSCTLNGRPDSGYVYWRWQPRGCELPAFSPDAFLRWLRNRHMAFVGDSLARNQGESLVCLLASRSPPELVHRSAEDGGRFRRWVFPEFGASVSIFWSPFLVRGVEKSERDGVRYNQVFLGAFDERWMSQLADIDAAVLSAGQWFRIPSIYHDGGRVVGCHGCAPEFNGTAEISFFHAFRTAVRRTLAEAARRHERSGGGAAMISRPKLVALTTFSPSHFEGEWNKGAPCKKKPDKELGYTETEMRKIVVEESRRAAAASSSSLMRFAVVDVTALANQRPDGHPGPYMRKNPFAGGNTSGPVQHDCLHWCMPGPVDTFNQILLQTMLS